MFSIEHQSSAVAQALSDMEKFIQGKRLEFITPEHLLWAIALQPTFYLSVRCRPNAVSELLSPFFERNDVQVPPEITWDGAMPSRQFIEMLNTANELRMSSEGSLITVPHIVQAILELEHSYACEVLEHISDGDTAEMMAQLIDGYTIADDDINSFDNEDFGLPGARSQSEEWRGYVTRLNDMADSHNPLIGRQDELERTMQVLCRKDKNNPLHVGEAGVGKTALAFGLAALIEKGSVPDKLAGASVYELDLGALLAGTQYRGEFEKRIKGVLDALEHEGNVILYIDEIHSIIGAGRVEGGAMDASNMLKRHLELGNIRFMGATTYEEYNKNFVRNKAFSRRFEKIDICEPSIDQCKEILRGLKEKYESFHAVTYTDDAIDYAVEAADKYITGRYLPDKAIDLIDEAGAMHHLHATSDAVIDRAAVARVVARICNVDTLAERNDDTERLQHLRERILSQIYGQDTAVTQVVEAVQMGSAGLIDDNKPMASLLFVGPTGVGKTEVARVLAKELGLPLLRFDMSEYAEKHTVAKLIGAPAGYVGYDDGGLLTDAIRKTPHCVLLFDELEKAHSDIYNILLQVMDYAVLTDNRGQKADFRHVIFIMTTNSGAQYASVSPGFVKGRSSGQAMMRAVKQTFKPEFLNRLSAITIFNDMDRTMAQLILDKKLDSLSQKLAAKGVTIELDESARELLMREGFSEEYGGREIERVINGRLKPQLMRAILFGSLRSGGHSRVTASDGALQITV